MNIKQIYVKCRNDKRTDIIYTDTYFIIIVNNRFIFINY